MRFFIATIFILSAIANYASAQVIGVKKCECVPSNKCFPNLVPGNNSGGQIDIRIVNNGGNATSPPGGCASGLVQCCNECGVAYTIPGPNPAPGQGRYGSQPWQAALYANGVYIGGGVLINANHVLTAAHKVFNFTSNPKNLIVRLGDWDAANKTAEVYPEQNRTVLKIFMHEMYKDAAKNLTNDVALLRLSESVKFGPTVNPAINTACLPEQSTNFENTTCIVSGWGKNAFNGSYQNIIKEVDVPIINSNVCETKLKPRLYTGFFLDKTSFICAGGKPNKDACVGDGGSPLMCKNKDRYQVVGLVAWGIGCANGDIPGVYVRVQSYLQWIQNKTATP